MRDVIYSSVRPLMLGDGKTARQAAWRFFAAYGVTSTVMDIKRSLISSLSPFLSFRHLPPVKADEFILMSLERFADEAPDVTVIIVPCEELFRDFIDRNLARLEARFIIRSPERVCDVRPSQRHIIKD